jgi:hypothetical protein
VHNNTLVRFIDVLRRRAWLSSPFRRGR